MTKKEFNSIVRYLNENNFDVDGGVTSDGILYSRNPFTNMLEPIIINVEDTEEYHFYVE